MTSTERPAIIFDTSAINALAGDSNLKALQTGICSSLFVRVTETNIAEIAATSDTGRRTKLLNFIRSFSGSGECILPPNEILRRLRIRFMEDPVSFDWSKVSVRFPEGERELARNECISDELSLLQRDSALLYEAQFADLLSASRPEFEALSAVVGDPPRLEELLETARRSIGSLWALNRIVFSKGQNEIYDEQAARMFYDRCPPYRALVLALFVGFYDRSIKSARSPVSARAGRADSLSAVYLPYCEQFITRDKRQLNCLQLAAAGAELGTQVRASADFISGIIISTRE